MTNAMHNNYNPHYDLSSQEIAIIESIKREEETKKLLTPVRMILELASERTRKYKLNKCNRHGVSYTDTNECPFCLSGGSNDTN